MSKKRKKKWKMKKKRKEKCMSEDRYDFLLYTKFRNILFHFLLLPLPLSLSLFQQSL